MAIDRQRLVKFMMMTTSSNDSEALIAIRKANALLRVNNTDWSGILKPPTPYDRTVNPQPQPRPPSRPKGRGVFNV